MAVLAGVRSRSFLLVMSFLAIVLGAAEAAPPVRWQATDADTRRYEGRRFLTSSEGTRVYERSSPTSAVVFDVPLFRVVYAKATDRPDWLEVTGVGTSRFAYAAARTFDAKDGKAFLSHRRVDEDLYYPLRGFVLRAGLRGLDVPEPPVDPKVLRAVPNLWSDLGVVDRRRFATDMTRHPFDAVVQVQRMADGRAVSQCTGFFYLDLKTVVTAAHCIDGPVRIAIVRRSGTEYIDTEMSSRTEYDPKGKVDWGVLKLKSAPKSGVDPFEPFDGSTTDDAFIKAVQIGYSGDLFIYQPKEAGFVSPNVSVCEIYPADISAQENYLDRYAVVRQRSCPVWHGDSGGPLLVWNAGRKRFQVIGVLSRGTNPSEDEIAAAFGSFSASQKDVLLERINTSLLRFGRKTVRDLTDDAAALMVAPNWSALQYAALAKVGVFGDNVATFSASMTQRLGNGRYNVDSLMERLTKERSHEYEPSPEYSWMNTDNWDLKFVRTAQRFCLRHCTERTLDTAHRIGTTLGDYLSLTGDAQEIQIDGISASDPPEQGWHYYVIGGDLYATTGDVRYVRRVFRNAMNLVEAGDPDYNRLGCGICEVETGWKEKSDVAPTDELRTGTFGARTPASLPGASTIFPREAFALTKASRPVVLDVTGSRLGVPGAVSAVFAASPGTFSDATQGRLSDVLARLTGGDKRRPVVVYCHHAQCWLSYNVALRAVHLGYADVRWMRQGIEGWLESGLPLGRVAPPPAS